MNALLYPVGITETIEQRCDIYRDQFGLSAFSDARSKEIRLATGRHWAVLLPPTLGRAVRIVLRAHPAPMFSINAEACVVLAEAPVAGVDAAELSFELYRCGAVPVLPGTCIALPTPGRNRCCWLQLPAADCTFPAFDIVVDAVHIAYQKGSESPD